MPTLDQRIEKRTTELAQLKKRKALADAAANRKTRSTERQKDAHRKITLGGLVIVGGADGWDPAEIVGVLLAGSAHREKCRQLGIDHMAQRDAARAKK